MNIPVSIEGKYYDENDFIDIINKKNQAVYHGKSGAKCFKEYIERNKVSSFMRVLLFYLYDVITPQSFNGINHWQDRFNKSFSQDNSNKRSEDLNIPSVTEVYLQDILVSKLNNYLCDRNKVSCKNYKEYIYSCIAANYTPKLDIRWSDEYGWGVYALENIYSFMFLGLYVGQVQQLLWLKLIDIIRGFHNKYELAFCYNEVFAINGEKKGNYTRFINHDTNGGKKISTFSLQIADNGEIGIPHRGFIANVPKNKNSHIVFAKDEQLLWDYGKYYKLNL